MMCDQSIKFVITLDQVLSFRTGRKYFRKTQHLHECAVLIDIERKYLQAHIAITESTDRGYYKYYLCKYLADEGPQEYSVDRRRPAATQIIFCANMRYYFIKTLAHYIRNTKNQFMALLTRYQYEYNQLSL